MNRVIAKLLVKLALWLVFVIIVVALVMWRLNVSRQFTRIAVSEAMVDSLLHVSVPADRPDTLVNCSAFVVHFNPSTHMPNCVAYHLTASRLQAVTTRDETFWHDDGIVGCAHLEDYVGSGYDRGHMVPAADMTWDTAALRNSFSLINVCPQLATLNQGGWARLEQKLREWVARDSVLLVWCGPIPGAAIDTVGQDCHIAVPRQFFKVVLAPAVVPTRAVAFVYDNDRCNGKLAKYAVSVDSVERLTGLSFFGSMQDDKQQAKRHVNLDAWLR